MSDAAYEHAYPQPGDLVDDKYEVRRELGSGGMGAVLEATHLLRKARVALKFMSPRIVHVPGLVERFLNEGVVASRINNEHVVAVLDVSKLPSGLPYLVMECLEGQDLRQLLAREGTPGLSDVPRAVHFVLQVLRGLQAAHQVGIVHRDLKPANCFVVERDGEPDFIKLVDFGISKFQEGDSLNLTQAGAALGTPLYISPEQAHNPRNVDARTDLYSVAVILYELLAGRTPFASETGSLMQLFQLLATTDPTPLSTLAPDVPAGLASVVSVGLARAAEARFQSCSEFASELAPFADARSELVVKQLMQRPSAGPGRMTPSPPRPSSLPLRLVATATAVAVPAAALGSRPPAASSSAASGLAGGSSPAEAPAAGAAALRPRAAGARWGMAGVLVLAAVAAWAFSRSSWAPAVEFAAESAVESAAESRRPAPNGGAEPSERHALEVAPAPDPVPPREPDVAPSIRPLAPSVLEASEPPPAPAEPPRARRRAPALNQIRIEE